MKNRYKINEILDAVNIILNQKDKMIEKKKETVLRLVDEIKEDKVNLDEIPKTTENIIKGGHHKLHLIESGFQGIKQIRIIGWGSQAPAQYQNINDSLRLINSNITVKVGLRENSKSYNNVFDEAED